MRLKILIAPDSFKESLSAIEAAESIESGILRAVPNAHCLLVPLADGGEGTVHALVKATNGRVVHTKATGPLDEKIDSFYGILGDRATCVVEMAAASGLPLIPEGKRNPMLATTYGTGELIRSALDTGCKKLILGIGGSATNDGGIGAVQALGGSFIDENGLEVGLGGKELTRIRKIDLSGIDPRLAKTKIIVACDVDNPLTGECGAAAVFSPQKGATPQMVKELDSGLRNLAEVIRHNLGIDIENTPGAGAAGGLGGGAMAFLHAEMQPGIKIVLDATDFRGKLQGTALIITGEGRIDSQTLNGKTISGVLKIAQQAGIPVLAIGGGVESQGYELLHHGAVAVLSIVNRPMTLSEAQSGAKTLLEDITEQAMRLLMTKLDR